jgi:hypothetical protein
MMRYGICLVIIIQLFWVAVIPGCSSSPEVLRDVGEVKVSLFQLTEGRMAKEILGTYVALVSGERYQHCGIKLNEVFEEVTQPLVSVMDAETADALVRLIYEQDFYALPAVALDQIRIEDVKSAGFKVKILTVEINGIAHTVVYDTLPERYKPVFNTLSRAVFLALETTDVKPVLQKQDWREAFEEYLQQQGK